MGRASVINLIVRGRICSLHEFIWAILQQWHAVRFVLALCSEEGVGGGVHISRFLFQFVLCAAIRPRRVSCEV
jgi:hypothetical protein